MKSYPSGSYLVLKQLCPGSKQKTIPPTRVKGGRKGERKGGGRREGGREEGGGKREEGQCVLSVECVLWSEGQTL